MTRTKAVKLSFQAVVEHAVQPALKLLQGQVPLDWIKLPTKLHQWLLQKT
jgi:hypothetical protein